MQWYSIGKIGLTPLIIWEQVYMIFDCFYCVLLTIGVYLREGTCLWRPQPPLFHNRWIHRLSRLLPWLMEPPHLSSIQKVCFILLLAWSMWKLLIYNSLCIFDMHVEKMILLEYVNSFYFKSKHSILTYPTLIYRLSWITLINGNFWGTAYDFLCL